MSAESYRLGIQVDTRDIVALLEIGRMCAAIADARIDVRHGLGISAAETVAAAKTERGPDKPGAEEAFSQVEDAGRVDAGTAFATAGAAGPAGPTVQEQPPAPGQAQAGAAAGPAVELDKNSLPWDSRINTSNKAQTKQGVWKRAPGLSDEVYNGILAELKATMNNAPPQPAGQAEGAGAAAPPPPAGAGAAQPPAPGPAGPAADTPAEPVPTNFSDFLAAVSKRTTCNPPKLTKPEMDTCMQIVGATHGCTLNTLADLNVRPDLIPVVYAEFANVWNGR